MKPLLHGAARAVLASLVIVALLAPRTAWAEASADDPQGKLEDPNTKTDPPQRTWRKDGSWGWFLAASSIFVGGGITVVGLNVSCTESSHVENCERRSSFLIWGGIGLAAVGSMLGLAVVANGRERVQGPKPVALQLRPIQRMCAATSVPTP